MFTWNVEEMKLMNQKSSIIIGNEKIYDCEYSTSKEEKIAFVDSMNDGKLSYLLDVIQKFNNEKDSLKKDDYGCIKTVSLQAWLKKNDPLHVFYDSKYDCGELRFLGSKRYLTEKSKPYYDTYVDLVDEVFHRQLKECEKEENKYFTEHDEYCILKEKFRNKKYSTTFGANIGMFSDGSVRVISEDGERDREITMDELKLLLQKYDELDQFVEKISKDVNIKY